MSLVPYVWKRKKKGKIDEVTGQARLHKKQEIVRLHKKSGLHKKARSVNVPGNKAGQKIKMEYTRHIVQFKEETSSVLSGVATMLRQSVNIFDTAKAICSRSNRVLGFVIQHRIH